MYLVKDLNKNLKNKKSPSPFPSQTCSNGDPINILLYTLADMSLLMMNRNTNGFQLMVNSPAALNSTESALNQRANLENKLKVVCGVTPPQHDLLLRFT
jgi:hypothetical protein